MKTAEELIEILEANRYGITDDNDSRIKVFTETLDELERTDTDAFENYLYGDEWE